MITPINERRYFKIEQAQELLPVLMRITRNAEQRVKTQIPGLARSAGPEREQIEKAIHAEYHQWEEKISRLGGVAKGMWLVDFDSGEGYYCWQYPEAGIDHYHGYEEGFLGRMRLDGKSSENHPAC